MAASGMLARVPETAWPSAWIQRIALGDSPTQACVDDPGARREAPAAAPAL